MVPQLVIQLIILGVLATALIAYNRQSCRLPLCLFAVIGGGLAGNVVVFCLQLPYGLDADFVIRFFELYVFAVSGGCGLVVGGLTLALFSNVAAASKNSSTAETETLKE